MKSEKATIAPFNIEDNEIKVTLMNADTDSKLP